MSKTVEKLFIDGDEWNRKRLRGAFNQWLDQDWTYGPGKEKKVALNGKSEPKAVFFKEFESWLDDRVDDSWYDKKEEYGSDVPRYTFYEYWDNNEEFREEALSHSEDSSYGDGGDTEDGGSSVNREYERLSRKGIINENMDPDWAKLKGTMLLFSREVDEIKGSEKTFDIEPVMTAWHRWMQTKFDSEWVNFTYHHVPKGDMVNAISSLYDDNREFRGLVERKYEYDPDEGSGNGDPDEGDGESQEGDGKVKFGSQTFDKAESLDKGGSENGGKQEGSPTTITGYSGEGVKEEGGGGDNGERSLESTGRSGKGGRKISFKEYVAGRAERDDELKVNEIYEGNVWVELDRIPRNSIDAIITSPPYWALRDYDGGEYVPMGGDPNCDHAFNKGECHYCGAWQGQLGHEPEKEMFIENIVAIMEKAKAVIKPTGHLFLNIGDTYDNKSSQMVPERIYAKMVDEGWYLRDKIVWAKKVYLDNDELVGNGQPSPHDDRVAHQWEPHYHFTKSGDYWEDIDSSRVMPSSFEGDMGKPTEDSKYDEGEDGRRGRQYNPMGTNQPDVWQVNSDGYRGGHSAVFPEKLPGRSIDFSVPERVCGNCGKPYEKENIVENEDTVTPGGDRVEWSQPCACKEDYEPGIVCDIFLGSGTTAVAAANKGYRWCGIEMSEKYMEEARSRIPTGSQQKLTEW